MYLLEINMTHCLQDKTITGLEIAEDKEAIRFLIEGDDPIIAKCDADCCSHTWVEHIELPAMGFPAKVLGIEEIDLPGSADNHPDHDCLQVYGTKITTDKGDIVIDYRNSSNGYYGGSLSWPHEDDRFYGGVWGQNISKEEWKQVS